MAQALDTTTSDVNTAHQIVGGTTTWSHTCTGSNLVLIASFAIWNNGGTAAGMSAVLYGLQSMTLVPSSGSSNGNFYTEQWYLIAPTTGAHNIVATQVGSTDAIKTSGISVTGADQTTGYDSHGATTGTSGTVTQAITLTAANEFMVDIVCHLSANSPSANSDTLILNDTSVGVSGASQYVNKGSSGSQSMSYTYPDPGDAWAYSIVSILSAGGGGATSPRLRSLLGVGL